MNPAKRETNGRSKRRSALHAIAQSAKADVGQSLDAFIAHANTTLENERWTETDRKQEAQLRRAAAEQEEKLHELSKRAASAEQRAKEAIAEAKQTGSSQLERVRDLEAQLAHARERATAAESLARAAAGTKPPPFPPARVPATPAHRVTEADPTSPLLSEMETRLAAAEAKAAEAEARARGAETSAKRIVAEAKAEESQALKPITTERPARKLPIVAIAMALVVGGGVAFGMMFFLASSSPDDSGDVTEAQAPAPAATPPAATPPAATRANAAVFEAPEVQPLEASAASEPATTAESDEASAGPEVQPLIDTKEPAAEPEVVAATKRKAKRVRKSRPKRRPKRTKPKGGIVDPFAG